MTLPTALYEAIEVERANLSRAASLLACMSLSLELEVDRTTGPYYPDLTEMAHDMVRRSINGLDSLALQQAMSRNSVKEDFGPQPGAPLPLQACAHGFSSSRSLAHSPARLRAHSRPWAAPNPVSGPSQQEKSVAVNGFDPRLHAQESRTLQ